MNLSSQTQAPLLNPETAALLNNEFSIFDLVLSHTMTPEVRGMLMMDMYTISWHTFLEERLPLLMTEYQKDSFAKMIDQEVSFAELYAQLVENVPNFTELWLDSAEAYKRRWVKNYWSQLRLSLETSWSQASAELKSEIAERLSLAKSAEKLADRENWSELKTLLQETEKQTIAT